MKEKLQKYNIFLICAVIISASIISFYTYNFFLATIFLVIMLFIILYEIMLSISFFETLHLLSIFNSNSSK